MVLFQLKLGRHSSRPVDYLFVTANHSGLLLNKWPCSIQQLNNTVLYNTIEETVRIPESNVVFKLAL